MTSMLCLAILYLLLQLNIALSKRKLVNWDNPKWMPELFQNRQKQNKRTFIIQWTLICLGAMFLDVGVASRIMGVYRGPIDAFVFWPFITFLAFSSYLKAEYLHLMYHAWGIIRLQEKLNQKGKE